MKKSIFLGIVLAVASIMTACGGSDEPIVKVLDAMPKSAKRGVAYNFPSMSDAIAMTPYITWCYNWGNALSYDILADWLESNEMDFCPMCWNGNYNVGAIKAYVAAHPNTKYLLAFNEPNLTDQANMVPSKAAELWAPVVALAKELNLKLVSPAMNYGTLAGYSDPIKWLDEFFAQPGVSLDDIDAISLHCYMGSSSALASFVDRFDKYGKPIWMTEFCAWEKNIGSAKDQMLYMSEVLNYFEQTDKVERYAWFIPRYKKVGTYPYMQLFEDDNSDFTALGKVYTRFSSFDKNTYLKFPIEASQYVGISDMMIHVAPSTDPMDAGTDALMISGMEKGKFVEYQVLNSSDVQELKLRYSSYNECGVAIYVDGDLISFETMPKSNTTSSWDDVWATYGFPVAMTAGKHTFRIELMTGTMDFSKLLID